MPGCKALMLRRVRRGYIKGDFKMKDAVVIKGNKAGMTVYLEKDLNYILNNSALNSSNVEIGD